MACDRGPGIAVTSFLEEEEVLAAESVSVIAPQCRPVTSKD
jgi:hypothetical protein